MLVSAGCHHRIPSLPLRSRLSYITAVSSVNRHKQQLRHEAAGLRSYIPAQRSSFSRTNTPSISKVRPQRKVSVKGARKYLKWWFQGLRGRVLGVTGDRRLRTSKLESEMHENVSSVVTLVPHYEVLPAPSAASRRMW